ncbi:HesB/IscA family protein [Pelagicoccus mobilis]|uniref:Iron-sulfur cluster assembly accessory protein n=1 Tax=Pelagicoccus mobilis TaxID=415221 RepID=A0A934RTZ3_9BACT|nr:iron-sulfur cluster assembly accessory protein [Pelagicoccus mobilis]MBK1876356.1 iron-sulfur cluster assembly accessory protein [Pelagicoccus mobilis]
MSEETAVQLPEGVRIGDDRLIYLSDPAVKKVCKLAAKEDGKPFLRVGIAGGGCNGLSYKMRFVEKAKKGDILVPFGEAKVIVDSKSALYLKGTQLDYSDALISGGFKFSNPNASSSCSCGESFSV